MISIHNSIRISIALLLVATAASAGDGPQQEILIPALEPGDTSLVYGSRTVGASILSSLDTDGFLFPGVAGDNVRIRIFTPSTTLVPRCKVVRSDGSQVTTGVGASFEMNVALTATATGTAPFKLILDDGNSNTGNYELALERIPPPPAERVLGYNRPATDTLDHPLDLDAFRVEMIAGVSMQIRFNGAGGVIDPLYELYDPAGVRRDTAISTNGATVTRTVTPTMTGTYVLLMSDRDRNDTGDYTVVVTCVAGACPPTAAELVRNGSGINPLAYSVACPAVLGGVLKLEIDTSTCPGATRGIVQFYTAGTPGTPSPYGEILVDLTSGYLGKLISVPVASKASFEEVIPADHSLAGFFTSSQGILLGCGVQLTNAIDITVGF